MTRTMALPRTLTLWAALTALGAAGCRAQHPSFDGTYAVTVGGGAVTIAIRTLPSGEVRGWMRGSDPATFRLEGRVTTDEDGDATVEGTLTGNGMRSDFTLFPEEDGDYGLLIIPYDAAGTPRSEQAAVYAAARTSSEPPDLDAAGAGLAAAAATQPPAATPAAPASGTRDPRLVGIWSAQILMNSPAGGGVVEMRMQFGADGVLRDLGSRGFADIADGIIEAGPQGGGDQAAWRTEGDVIWVSYAGSRWVPFARFQFSGNRMLLRYLHDGSQQLWSRAGG